MIKLIKPILLIILFLFCTNLFGQQIQERFPKPDFQSEYTRPDIHTSEADSMLSGYIDLFVLFVFLSLASYFALKQRSRRNIFILTLASLVYFGFYREGCVCSVGSVQNVTFALFNSGYAIPITVILFFLLPLVFALYYGRVFCSSVCPLGAIQDVVSIKNTKVSPKLEGVLGTLPYLYLGLAILFAANGAGFIICQYDPFVGFFRFGATFNMLIFGAALLLLGTVVARPYCRFLCPYGVLLSWMSFLSKKHVSITPDKCNNCRLCENACPVDAIKIPVENESKEDRKKETKKFISLFILLPFLMAAGGYIVSNLNGLFASQHHKVYLAEQLKFENENKIPLAEQSDETKAFRQSGELQEVLFKDAESIRTDFNTGGWIVGALVAMVLFFKLVNLTIKKQRKEYEIDKSSCISCGKCFIYCPYEKVRLGLLSPEEVDNY